MPKKGGQQTDDGREKGTVAKARGSFKHTPGDPNEGVKKLGSRKGAE